MAVHYGSKVANALIMGGTSFSFPTAPSVQGDVLAYHVASAALLPTSRAWGIATTSTAGIVLANTTAATAGVPVQYSPALQLDGTANDTDGSVSVTERWRIENHPANGNTVSSVLAFMRAQGAGAFSTPAYLSSAGGLVMSSSLTTIGFVMVGNAASGAGVGTGDIHYSTTAANPILTVHYGRTDGANNIVHANVYDRSAASITNAATMRLWSGGWTNNSDAYTELGALYCDGSLWSSTGVRFPAYATAAMPTAGATGQVVYCSDGNTGAKCLAMWDGSNWLRIVLGAAVASS